MARDSRERWNERHAGRARLTDPAVFVAQSAPLLPASGVALDVAGGTGRNALWLAAAGLTVTLTDISDVALDLARADAASMNLPIDTIHLDLEIDGLPAGTWDVIIVHHFLDRRLLETLPDALNPGGLILVVHPTVRNLERNPRPGRRFLLGEGELASIVAGWGGMEILTIDEGWTPEGRHEARLRARRRG